MCDVISLSDYKKKLDDAKEEQEVDSLWEQVDEIMERISEIEPETYYPPMQTDADALAASGIQIGPSESALLNAYYTLINEGRDDLADLVMEILKMK